MFITRLSPSQKRYSMSQYAMIFLIKLLVIYTLIALGMYLFQRRLLYLPSDVPQYPTSRTLEQIDHQRLTTEDGEQIIIWSHPAQNSEPTVVYFHGNAGSVENRIDKYRALTDQGFGLLALSYRGYGGSTGTPTEQGLYTDARTIIQHALAQGIPTHDIVLYGESLGSGVAVQMATEYPVGAVVLEAPYTSVAGRAKELYPWLPVEWLIKDRFDSIKKVAQIEAPVLIFHGEMDTTMPVHHGKTLFEAASEPKKAFFYPEIGHTDFDIPTLAKETAHFVHQYRATP